MSPIEFNKTSLKIYKLRLQSLQFHRLLDHANWTDEYISVLQSISGHRQITIYAAAKFVNEIAKQSRTSQLKMLQSKLGKIPVKKPDNENAVLFRTQFARFEVRAANDFSEFDGQ